MKERLFVYKLGVVFCDYNYERKYLFGGFIGVVNFVKEVNFLINSLVWKYVKESEENEG